MLKNHQTRLTGKAFLLVAFGVFILSACRESAEVQHLRVVNMGSFPIHNLVVIFPGERIAFGDVPAGEATEYKEVPEGVYGYAAYQFEVDGQPVTEPAIDWIGESPLSGTLFTYTIDFDPERTNTGDRIRLLEVKNDD